MGSQKDALGAGGALAAANANTTGGAALGDGADQVPFQPVVLGSDIGTYAMARSFYEGWHVKPVVITTMVLGPIQHSRIIDVRLVDPAEFSRDEDGVAGSAVDAAAPGADSDAAARGPAGGREAALEPAPMIQALLRWGPRLQREFPGKRLLLVANTDTNVRDIMLRADELRRYYTFAFPDPDIVALTNNKEEFPRVAAKYGMTVPTTIPVELTDTLDQIREKLAPLTGEFPWIIKSAVAYGYERLKWPGKKKVYSAANWDEAAAVFRLLREICAAHPDIHRFVVQPKIEGNDTYDLSLTTYTDSRGRVTMFGSAQVLLEDHNPTALGNPAAMITEPYPGLYRPVRAFLQGVGWHGYSNYDVKVDNRTGRVYFLEVNPRIGRNCYYNTAAGLNAMKYVVQDMVYGRSIEPEVVRRRILYTVLPKRLIMRYIDRGMRDKVAALYRAGRVVNPLRCPAERQASARFAKRAAYVALAKLNHIRKYHRHYPRATFRAGPTESFDTTALTHPGK